jgi:hypothetical protein
VYRNLLDLFWKARRRETNAARIVAVGYMNKDIAKRVAQHPRIEKSFKG